MINILLILFDFNFFFSFNFLHDYGKDFQGILQICKLKDSGGCDDTDATDKSLHVQSLNASDFIELRPGKYEKNFVPLNTPSSLPPYLSPLPSILFSSPLFLLPSIPPFLPSNPPTPSSPLVSSPLA